MAILEPVYQLEWYFGLFQNDLTPDEDTELADVVEATFPGYANFLGTWAGVTFDGLGRAIDTAAPITWSCDGGGAPQSIYGFFVFFAASQLMFIQRFAAPRSMTLAGDEITIVPTILCGNLAPP